MNSSPPQPERLGRQARLVVVVLAVCAAAALFWPRGDKAPDASGLQDVDGRTAPLEERLAPVTLVHFWATWCPPCRDEIPALQRLEKDLAENRDFRVVMVAVSDTPDQVRTMLGDGTRSVLFDPRGEVAKSYGTDKLPETYLVVGGQVVQKYVGQTDWDAPAVRQALTTRFRPS
ncbi:MAG TPA: TlpA disulfide reductase family protein [Thermoanaerobaculia bacterium]|nr:TlpA disulfide reductase family protein [Thermoanaerobaculia bacterium]